MPSLLQVKFSQSFYMPATHYYRIEIAITKYAIPHDTSRSLWKESSDRGLHSFPSLPILSPFPHQSLFLIPSHSPSIHLLSCPSLHSFLLHAIRPRHKVAPKVRHKLLRRSVVGPRLQWYFCDIVNLGHVRCLIRVKRRVSGRIKARLKSFSIKSEGKSHTRKSSVGEWS